jgi:hypothetical protein
VSSAGAAANVADGRSRAPFNKLRKLATDTYMLRSFDTQRVPV